MHDNRRMLKTAREALGADRAGHLLQRAQHLLLSRVSLCSKDKIG